MRIAGIMSGTSLDGIDVAIVEFDGARVETVAFRSRPYAEDVRAALLAVSNRECHPREIARLHFLLPELYAEAVKETCRAARVSVSSIQLVGCHGQTIFHEAGGAEMCGRRVRSTLQIGDGSVLAERLGAPVVSDFRPADVAAGGQGAPLVPFVDWLLLGDRKLFRVALNIGGIANITVLPPGCAREDVTAFDTGPGNMVIDGLARRYSRGRESCDRDGARAAAGRPDLELLAELMRDPYYRSPPPKSAGREQYGDDFVERLIARGLSPEDTLATATMLTAATVADAICAAAGGDGEDVDEVIVSGGGVHNPTLMRYLRAELPDSSVVSSAAAGIDPDGKEAIAFAVLAHETWHGRPANLPSATGARHPVLLGKKSVTTTNIPISRRPERTPLK